MTQQHSVPLRKNNRWDAIHHAGGASVSPTSNLTSSTTRNDDDFHREYLEGGLPIPRRKKSMVESRRERRTTKTRGRAVSPVSQRSKRSSPKKEPCKLKANVDDTSTKKTKNKDSKNHKKKNKRNSTISLDDYMTKEESLQGIKQIRCWWEAPENESDEGTQGRSTLGTMGTCTTEEYYTSSSSDYSISRNKQNNSSDEASSASASSCDISEVNEVDEAYCEVVRLASLGGYETTTTTATGDDATVSSESSNASKLDKLRGKMKKLREQAHKQIIQSRTMNSPLSPGTSKNRSLKPKPFNYNKLDGGYSDDDDMSLKQESDDPWKTTNCRDRSHSDAAADGDNESSSSSSSIDTHSSHHHNDEENKPSSMLKIEIGPIHTNWENHGRFCYNKKVPTLAAPKRDSSPYNSPRTPTSVRDLNSSLTSLESTDASSSGGRRYASGIKIKKTRKKKERRSSKSESKNTPKQVSSSPETRAKTERRSSKSESKKSSKQTSSSPETRAKTERRSSKSESTKTPKEISSSPEIETRKTPKESSSSPQMRMRKTPKQTSSSPQMRTKKTPKQTSSSPQMKTKKTPKQDSSAPVSASTLRLEQSIFLADTKNQNRREYVKPDRSALLDEITRHRSNTTKDKKKKRSSTSSTISDSRVAELPHQKQLGRTNKQIPAPSVETCQSEDSDIHSGPAPMRSSTIRSMLLSQIEHQNGKTPRSRSPSPTPQRSMLLAQIEHQNGKPPRSRSPSPTRQPALLADIRNRSERATPKLSVEDLPTQIMIVSETEKKSNDPKSASSIPTRAMPARMMLFDDIKNQTGRKNLKPVTIKSTLNRNQGAERTLKPIPSTTLANIDTQRKRMSPKPARPSFLADIEKQGGGRSPKTSRPSFLADIEKQGGGRRPKASRPSFLADIEKQGGGGASPKPTRPSFLADIEKQNGGANLQKSTKASFLADIRKRGGEGATRPKPALTSLLTEIEKGSSLLQKMDKRPQKGSSATPIKPARPTSLLAEIEMGVQLKPFAARSEPAKGNKHHHRQPTHKQSQSKPVSMMDELKMRLTTSKLKPVSSRKASEAAKPNAAAAAAAAIPSFPLSRANHISEHSSIQNSEHSSITDELKFVLERRKNKTQQQQQQRQQPQSPPSASLDERTPIEESPINNKSRGARSPTRGSKKWLSRKNGRRNSEKEEELTSNNNNNNTKNKKKWGSSQKSRKTVLRDVDGEAPSVRASPPLREGGKSDSDDNSNNKWSQRSFWKTPSKEPTTTPAATTTKTTNDSPATRRLARRKSKEKSGATADDNTSSAAPSQQLGPIQRLVRRTSSKGKKVPNSKKQAKNSFLTSKKKLVRSKSSKEKEDEESGNNSKSNDGEVDSPQRLIRSVSNSFKGEGTLSGSGRRLLRSFSNSSKDNEHEDVGSKRGLLRRVSGSSSKDGSLRRLLTRNPSKTSRGNGEEGNPLLTPTPKSRRLARSVSRSSEDWGKNATNEANLKPKRRRSSRKSLEKEKKNNPAAHIDWDAIVGNEDDADDRRSPPQQRKVSRLIEAMEKRESSRRLGPPSPWRDAHNHHSSPIGQSLSRDDDDDSRTSPGRNFQAREDVVVVPSRRQPWNEASQKHFLQRKDRLKEYQASNDPRCNNKNKRGKTLNRHEAIDMCAGIE